MPAKNFICVSLLLILGMGYSACTKESEINTDIVVKNNIPLSSNQEVPVNASTATGSLDVSYSKITKVLNYTVRWSGLTATPTAMHFHGNIGRGTNASVLQGVSGFPASATAAHSGSITLDNITLKQDSLLAGRWYFNIHTATYPGGEIRGQVEF